jgi:hypothetical protein
MLPCLVDPGSIHYTLQYYWATPVHLSPAAYEQTGDSLSDLIPLRTPKAKSSLKILRQISVTVLSGIGTNLQYQA